MKAQHKAERSTGSLKCGGPLSVALSRDGVMGELSIVFNKHKKDKISRQHALAVCGQRGSYPEWAYMLLSFWRRPGRRVAWNVSLQQFDSVGSLLWRVQILLIPREPIGSV